MLVRDQDDRQLDLDGTEEAWLLAEAPSGHRKRFVASVDAATDTVVYVTQENDFDEWGSRADPWRLQVELVGASYHVRGRVELLEVQPNLDTPRIILRPDPAVVYLHAPFAWAEQYTPETVFGFDTAEGSFSEIELEGEHLPITISDGTTALVAVFP